MRFKCWFYPATLVGLTSLENYVVFDPSVPRRSAEWPISFGGGMGRYMRQLLSKRAYRVILSCSCGQFILSQLRQHHVRRVALEDALEHFVLDLRFRESPSEFFIAFRGPRLLCFRPPCFLKLPSIIFLTLALYLRKGSTLQGWEPPSPPGIATSSLMS